MSRRLLYQILLTGMGLSMIAIGASGPLAGYPWLAFAVYPGWYVIGLGAGIMFGGAAFLGTKAFS